MPGGGKGYGELAWVGRQLGVHPEALRGWVKQAAIAAARVGIDMRILSEPAGTSSVARTALFCSRLTVNRATASRPGSMREDRANLGAYRARAEHSLQERYKPSLLLPDFSPYRRVFARRADGSSPCRRSRDSSFDPTIGPGLSA